MKRSLLLEILLFTATLVAFYYYYIFERPFFGFEEIDFLFCLGYVTYFVNAKLKKQSIQLELAIIAGNVLTGLYSSPGMEDSHIYLIVTLPIEIILYLSFALVVVKTPLWKRAFLITFATFVVAFFAQAIVSTEFFSKYVYPEQTALSGFEPLDIAFNSRPSPKIDERFVLVNFGELDRRSVASLVQIISSGKPRVLGIDAFYNCEGGLRDTVNCPQLKDSLGNKMLSDAIREAGNVVLGEKLLQTDSLARFDSNLSDSLELPDPIFGDYAKKGFVTLPTDALFQEDVNIARYIYPHFMVKGERELAFSVQIAMEYDSLITNQFLARNKAEEVVNFRGNIDVLRLRTNSSKISETGSSNLATMFSVVDYDEVLSGNFNPELFKDKIVMIGWLGTHLGNPAAEDKFYTPLNPDPYGRRSNPDMFGLVIHANVVAMILNGDYIDETNQTQEMALAIILCLIHVALLLWILKTFPRWFEIISVGLVVLQLAAISILRLELFVKFSYKLNTYLILELLVITTFSVNICKELYHLSYKHLPKWLQEKL